MIGWFRPSRERRGEDSYLNVKVALFCLGAGIAMVGVASGKRWVINLAILVLLIGFVLRFLPKSGESEAPPPNE
jgi:hypothetical protein